MKFSRSKYPCNEDFNDVGGGESLREEEASYNYAVDNSSFRRLNLNNAPLKGLS
jgi:hypothetical protein